MSRSVRERLGGPQGYPGVVWWPSWMSGNVRESPRVVGRPSRMSDSGWEALPYIREWSGSLPE